MHVYQEHQSNCKTGNSTASGKQLIRIAKIPQSHDPKENVKDKESQGNVTIEVNAKTSSDIQMVDEDSKISPSEYNSLSTRKSNYKTGNNTTSGTKIIRSAKISKSHDQKENVKEKESQGNGMIEVTTKTISDIQMEDEDSKSYRRQQMEK